MSTLVVRNPPRPPIASLDALAGHGVATVHEAIGRRGLMATRLRAFDRPGAIVAAFLFFYGLFRIVAEVYRDSDQLIAGGAISMGQALSALMWLGAAFFAWWAATHRPRPA